MSDPDAVVLNPAYWRDNVAQLARVLARPTCARALRIPDPSGLVAAPDAVMSVYNSAYWSAHPDELGNALRRALDSDKPGAGGSGVGAAPTNVERLTYTVEEVAAMLGISRAFAYEAVGRDEIPHIRIGRRILVPKSALHALIASAKIDLISRGSGC